MVSDLGRAESFYRSALGFESAARGPVDPAVLNALGVGSLRANQVSMRIGREEISLVQFTSPGVSDPLDSRCNDLWFQHIAIRVADMQAAYECLHANHDWHPISTQGPETLPDRGVQAFKFRDPDGHPLELLWAPPGLTPPGLEPPATAGASPFIGVDHSAIAASSTRRSLAFYRSLGMRPNERALNLGPEQSRLDGLRAARVKVTRLRPASTEGPGLELLAYQPPGRAVPAPRVTDLSTDWITLAAITACAASAHTNGEASTAVPRMLIDPDGHRLVLMEATRAQ